MISNFDIGECQMTVSAESTDCINPGRLPRPPCLSCRQIKIEAVVTKNRRVRARNIHLGVQYRGGYANKREAKRGIFTPNPL